MAMTEDTQAPDPVALVEYVMQGQNLAEELEDSFLGEIASEVVQDFDDDKETMADWLDRSEKAIDLAKLVKNEKSYPFQGSANIKYPLVTTAALQFNARAYPAIIPSSDMVKVKVWGPDPEGQKAARGARVSPYLTWQFTSEMDEWERETDKLLMLLPIVGDMFRKVWFDGERIRSKLVEPGQFIVNANAQNLTEAPRVAEELELFPHEIAQRIKSGWFCDFEYDDTENDPQTFIEMHTRVEIEGVEAPYIVTVHKERAKVVRMVADFGPEDVKFATERRSIPAMVETPAGVVQTMQMQEVPVGIERINRASYFVHYQFMPGMEKGLFGTGLGLLLSDISSAVNTAFNQMIDAAHYSSLGGGFIGTEFRLRGGAQTMRPGEYKMVNAKGADIRSAIVEKTFPGPDQTMFAMLGMLIEAGKEISSTKDILSGDGRGAANMPATTAMAIIEQGMKVFTAAYKRIFRSLKQEFALVARLNAQTLDPRKYMAFLEMEADPAADFGARDMDIEPVADPNAVTKTQEMARAQLLMELAQTGMVNPQAAVARILEAASIDEIAELMPQPNPLADQMAQMDMALKQAQVAQAQADIQETLAKIEKMRADAASTLAGVDLDQRQAALDEMKVALEHQRDGLKTLLAETRADLEADRRASERVAREPRNGGAGAGNPEAGGSAPQGDVAGLLAGGALPGN
jgi:chaperonin GroES